MINARKMSILIVDDDPNLREALVEQLALYEEFDAVSVETGAAAVQAAKNGHTDLVIMDVGLPDIDGRDSVRLLRKNGFRAPIIMLTGHDTDSDTILGLDAGANDYMTKPFRFPVLLARIRAQLRQHETSEDASLIIGHYTFRPSSKLLVNPDGKKGSAHRKRDGSAAPSLSRRTAICSARTIAAGSLGLQFRRQHAHLGDAYLSPEAEGRARRGGAVDLGDRKRRLQIGCLSIRQASFLLSDAGVRAIDFMCSTALISKLDAKRRCALPALSRSTLVNVSACGSWSDAAGARQRALQTPAPTRSRYAFCGAKSSSSR